jgi:hypothetical protein
MKERVKQKRKTDVYNERLMSPLVQIKELRKREMFWGAEGEGKKTI